MHLKGIKIAPGTFIKCFKELDFRFDEAEKLAGWTVLAGPNGSGKSTFLELLAVALTGHEPIRHLSVDCYLKLEIELHPGDKGYVEQEPKTHQQKIGPHIFTTGVDQFMSPQLEPDKPKPGWFVAGYGSSRRIIGELAPNGYRKRHAVTHLLDPNKSLADAVAWLMNLDYAAKTQSDSKKKRQATVTRDIAVRLVNRVFEPENAKITDINNEGIYMSHHNEDATLFSHGDGFQSTAGLVLDMLRHMNLTFDHLETNQYGQVLNHGIVFIDEVETHLHPSWQMRIGHFFKESFPNIQFIVTTHSPFICQAANPGCLLRLYKDDQGSHIERLDDDAYFTVVNGSPDNAVVTRLFGLEYTHSKDSEELRERIAELEFKLLEDGLSKSEETTLEKLLQMLPRTGSSAVERAIRARMGQ